ncbi:2,3-dihydro-2,3-dihydroxybenzoate dehydrogenase [Polymorphospora sp. NPDC051019]|uniref:2,3-dihydro-2,3-dihydroxybenzoate dehydrogenase n=1 Tax=Polymorphospora sp. NPDC051019 TaxID=3155725 RepID=UPI003427240E
MHPALTGTVAIVTGAGRGIGAAVARRLAESGATVAATDLDGAAVRGLAASAAPLPAGQAASGSITGYPLDVTDAADVESTVDRVEAELGPVGVLVNVAGVLLPGPVAGYTDADWARTFAINTTGVFYLCRAVTGRMAGRGGGAVVTVASNAASVPRVGMAAYAASKAAAAQFTRSLGLEVARYGIRCNVVSPGSTDTPMLRTLWTDDSGPAATLAGQPEAFRVGIPLGRIAEPDDIADAVLFLASPQARHITLHNLCVDGGAALGA